MNFYVAVTFFHTFCDIFEQTSFIGDEASGQKFQRQIYPKYINADMSYCCRVLKGWKSYIWDGGDTVVRV